MTDKEVKTERKVDIQREKERDIDTNRPEKEAICRVQLEIIKSVSSDLLLCK